MEECYRSNGKFLLTGEYLVLKGATALALPLKPGQSLDVRTLDRNENKIYWKAVLKPRENDTREWFSAVLDKDSLSVIATDDKEKAERLSNILGKVKSLNDNIFSEPNDYSFTTVLDFDPQWGLGSSSTLINNVSEWAKINPYQLLEQTFKGSGYDIACAKANGPIFYKDKEAEHADFKPEFKDRLYFVYQGKKQNSANEVKAFLDKNKNYEDEVKSISAISKIMPDIKSLRDFCYFIKVHEEIMSSCLEQKRIKKHFTDFDGEMKSLGAWGGDFILAATEWDDETVRKYFKNKGLNVIIKYNDIVL